MNINFGVHCNWMWRDVADEFKVETSGPTVTFSINELKFYFGTLILQYPKGYHAFEHVDGNGAIKSFLCFNLITVLKKAKEGGEFSCPEAWINLPRIKLFNGDKQRHGVSEVKKGTRIVFLVKFSVYRPIEP
ncbi:hypothetical protein L0Y69_01715 [bacterium]|nr:hypothetical protein [bacterium]